MEAVCQNVVMVNELMETLKLTTFCYLSVIFVCRYRVLYRGICAAYGF
jgi:hypothetical protein